MRVALAQLDARLGDVQANLARAQKVLAEARSRGADLVVFPELFLSGYALRSLDRSRETALGAEEVAATLADGPATVVGFHEPGANSAAYVDGGHLRHLHRKLYLVDYAPFHEDELFTSGSELRAFDTPLGRLAILICNDAWQPVVPFLAARDGARVLLVPSCSSTAVPEAEEYWRELTRFQARMLQCFVVFVNRVGSEAGFTYWGGSHAVGPSGELLAEAPRFEEAIVFADLHLEHVDARRRELPLFREPRLDLLRGELERLSETQQSLR
jgi:predicted amidohydrolase